MKRKMHEIHEEELKKCIDFIEQGISAGHCYSKISAGLECEFNSRYGTLRRIFSQFTPYSINRYIKRRFLTEAYLKLKRKGHKPTTRETICGMEYFVNKFEREFNLSVTGDYTEEDLQPAIDLTFLKDINNILYKLPIVDSFQMNEDLVDIEVNLPNTLKAFLSFKSYILPSELIGMFEEEDDDYKIFFLELISRNMQGNHNKIQFDEIEVLQSSARLYNFDARTELGKEFYVFCPEVPEFLHETFLTICDSLMPFIKTIIPKYKLHYDNEKVIYAISDADSIGEAAFQIAMGKDETKELIWGMLNDGWLRYMAV